MFHRIDDSSKLDARTFVMLAERLAAYPGAVQASLRAIAQEMAEDEEDEPYGVPAGRAAPPGMASGSSFDEQWKRATPVLAGHAAEGEAQILAMMTGAAR